MLIDFPLDEAAAAGGRFEAQGGALIFGAALPELAHGIQAGPSVARPSVARPGVARPSVARPGVAGPSVPVGTLAESEQSAFHVSEEGLPGQQAELGQCPRHQRPRNRRPRRQCR